MLQGFGSEVIETTLAKVRFYNETFATVISSFFFVLQLHLKSDKFKLFCCILVASI